MVKVVKGGYSTVCPKCGRRVKPEIEEGELIVSIDGREVSIPGLLHVCPECGSVVNFRSRQGLGFRNIPEGSYRIRRSNGARKGAKEETNRDIHPAIRMLINRLGGLVKVDIVQDRYGHVFLRIASREGKPIHTVGFFDSFRRAKHTPATAGKILSTMKKRLERTFPVSWFRGDRYTIFLIVAHGTRGLRQLIRKAKPTFHIVEKKWLLKKGMRLYSYIVNVLVNLIIARLKALRQKLQQTGIQQPWGPVKTLQEDLKLILETLAPGNEIIL